MRLHHISTRIKSFEQSEPWVGQRRCRRTMPGVETMEGRISLSSLPAVQHATASCLPAVQVRRVPALIGSFGMAQARCPADPT
jgi:hypothetical protein